MVRHNKTEFVGACDIFVNNTHHHLQVPTRRLPLDYLSFCLPSPAHFGASPPQRIACCTAAGRAVRTASQLEKPQQNCSCKASGMEKKCFFQNTCALSKERLSAKNALHAHSAKLRFVYFQRKKSFFID